MLDHWEGLPFPTTLHLDYRGVTAEAHFTLFPKFHTRHHNLDRYKPQDMSRWSTMQEGYQQSVIGDVFCKVKILGPSTTREQVTLTYLRETALGP